MIAAGMGWRGGFDTFRDPGTEAGAIEAIKLCLELGYDINAAKENKQTVLHGAIGRGPSVVEFLVRNGADMQARDNRGRTPLENLTGGSDRGGRGNQTAAASAAQQNDRVMPAEPGQDHRSAATVGRRGREPCRPVQAAGAGSTNGQSRRQMIVTGRVMLNANAPVRLALILSLLASAAVVALQKTGQPATLTVQDRAEIQQLSASYARNIGTCAAEEYANLFESPDGFYESLIRGRVMGKARLVALVKSERQCSQPVAERTARPAPVAVLEVTPEGIVGKVPLDAGHYEDVYVKTAAGWRFRSRNNIPKKAEDAGSRSGILPNPAIGRG